MSWTVNHNIIAPLQNGNILTTGLTITHNINPVTEASSTQVQSDWDQTDNLQVDFIKNKPTIPSAQVQSDWNATTGLGVILNKPTIPDELSDLAEDATHRTITNTEKAGLFEVFCFAVSDETTNITSGTAKLTLYWPYNFVATSVFIGVSTAPTGSNIIVDVNDHNGTTIFSSRPTILVNEFTSLTNGTQPVLATTTFTKGQKLTVDIDQAGSTIAGKSLKVYIIGNKS
jgi:hypothetical protein